METRSIRRSGGRAIGRNRRIGAAIAVAPLSGLFFLAGPSGCEEKPAAAAIANPDPTRCIVSGEKLPESPTFVTVNGKRFALCCKDCEPKLRKDPQHFLEHPGSEPM